MRPYEIEGGLQLDPVVVTTRELLVGSLERAEVQFPILGPTGALLMRTDSGIIEVDAGAAAPELTLLARAERPAVSVSSSLGEQQLLVDIRTFASESTFDELVITLTEELRQEIALHLNARHADDDVLRSEFVVDAAAGGGLDRLIATTGGTDREGFGLQGRTCELHLRFDDGVLWAERLVRRVNRQHPERHRLIEAPVRFSSVRESNGTSTTVRLRDEINQPDQLFEMWDLYNTLELDRLHDLDQRLGRARHGRPEERVEGTFLFPVRGREDRPFLQELETSGERVELVSRPVGATTDFDERDFFRGRVELVSPTGGYVVLRPDPGSGMDTPPSDGQLSIALAGGRIQARRRHDAYEKLATGQTQIAGLAELLRLQSPPPRRQRQRRERPTSPTVEAGFPGVLTARQREALDIAINTPDLALIQGPPGTGKSQVIAALQQRLAEISNSPTRSILLTSVQHDAVDQIAARTRIFGLPPHRFGNRREGVADPIGVWRQERIAALAHLRHNASGTLAAQWLNDLMVAHREAPPGPLGTAQLLRDTESRLGRMLPDDLRERLSQRADELERPQLNPSRAKRLERTVRALRTTAVASADDGRERLHDLMQLLTTFGGEMMDRWQQQLVDFASLSELPHDAIRKVRDEMLDEIVASRATIRPDIPDAVTERLLSEAAQRLRRPVATPLSRAEVLERYLIDLELYPTAVENSLRGYTAVWASTCQGAAGARTSEWLGDQTASEFPTVIVDEAARANPLDLLIPLTQANARVILVGDHRQLPQVIDERLRESLHHDDNAPGDPALLDRSLFERLFQHLRQLEIETGVKRAVTLDQQFRMHPRLARFVSDTFYAPHGEAFESGVTETEMAHEIERFEGRTAVWIDVPASAGSSQRDGTSWRRDREAKVVAELVTELLAEEPTRSIGVITFYAAQRTLILEELLNEGIATLGEEDLIVAPEWQHYKTSEGRQVERLRIGTVDSFQGKEFDVVILSMVRSTTQAAGRSARGLFGFLTSENRFCVALSRQRRLLVVVGDRAMCDLPEAAEVVGLRELAALCAEEI